MADTLSPLDQLKSFLNEIFQFETQDLDFGIYKIMHYKRKEIRNFIDKLLVEKVKEQLKTISDDETKSIGLQLKELEKDDVIKGWLAATDSDKTTLEKIYPDKFRLYQELSAKAKDVKVSEETENLIYNHLTQFFSRYYDKGDFISKRRFGKNEKYVVPYNGEETHFYWANHDQYYIKSSETFQHYAFRVSTHTGTLTVHFKLHNAQLEQGNVKADEPNFFMLAGKSPEIKENDEDLNFILADRKPEIGDHEVTFYFEYRPLDDSEKAKIKGNNKQDTLDEIAFDFLKKEFSNNPLFASLWKEQEGAPLLLKKLHHYTRKNKYDFFIHKNLKAFLGRELDFYIKTELVNVDDLYVTDAEEHFNRLRHNLKTIKVFKSIADTIIDFVSQIEDFQKKLWEKKKFVISTEWVITIDRLVEYLNNDEKLYRPILEEVIKNKDQVAEWKDFFGEENIPKKLSIDTLKADLHNWRKLPIDTVHFSSDFKMILLNELSENIDLESQNDGIILHSDNFHGLNCLYNKFNKLIQCIHIDPPYNTTTSGFLYKNTYEHSSWLTMIDNRLKESLDLLKSTASLQVHIDENEYERLHQLFNSYNLYNAGSIVWDKRNPMNGGSGLATQHEYIIWRTLDNHIVYARNININNMLLKVKELIDDEGKVNDSVRSKYNAWLNTNNELTGGEKAYRYIDDEGRLYQSVSLRAPEPRKDEKFHQPLIHPITNKPCPVPPNGFSRTLETLSKMVENGEILFGKDEAIQPRQKVLLQATTQRQFSTLIQDGKKGKADTKPLGIDFPYCHPISLYNELIGASDINNNDYVLDFFAGSGTTFHSVLFLNNEDKLHRKCILIEQEKYVETLIIPRIKKIAYTFNWKDGKPKDGSMNGLGIFFKYQRLEQYEEALENIAFNASEKAIQRALEFDQYIPKYFLEFETKGSNTLVNIEAMKDPWDYRLKIWDGYAYDTEKAVDLVETFNYLIGLHMQKCITKEINGRMYQFIYGYNNANKQILVIWRNVKDWTPDDYSADSQVLKKELANYKYDLLYINDQAHVDGYQPVEEVFKNKMLN